MFARSFLRTARASATAVPSARHARVFSRGFSAELSSDSYTDASIDRLEANQADSFLAIGTRRLFNADHDMFRESCREFFREHVVPHHAQWEEQGHVDREVWLKAGEMGLLGVNCPEKYGGLGADILYAAIVWEEQMYAKGSPSGPGFNLHSDIVMPYLLHLGTGACACVCERVSACFAMICFQPANSGNGHPPPRHPSSTLLLNPLSPCAC